MSEVTKLVAELEYRAETAEAELDRAYERYDQAEKDRNHWHDKAQEYKRRCELYEEQEMGVAGACCDREMALPRVITADEIKEGQLIAIHEEDTRRVDAGVVSRVENGGAILRLKGHGSTMFDLDRSQIDIIVLLADAPEPEPEHYACADCGQTVPRVTP